MLRAIQQIQPTFVVAENVSGLINWNEGMVFNEVQADLEAAGYEVTPFVLPAAGVNAPHRRDRVWFIAHSHNARINNASRLDGNRSAENEGRVKQSLVEHRQDGGNGTTTNADSNRHTLCETSGQTEISGSGNDGKQNERSEPTERANGLHGFHRATTNATRSSSKGKLQQEQEQRELGGCNSKDRINNWENFPTQSPICIGNDELSDRLVGITFPKWRNESIAALGNAIVPAVALQIFKAIQDVHLQLKK